MTDHEVSAKAIRKLGSVIGDNETVRHYLKAAKAEVDGDVSKPTTRIGIPVGVTDNRIAVRVPQVLGDEEMSIPFARIASVDLSKGITHRTVRIHTFSETYTFHKTTAGRGTSVEDVVRFINRNL